MGRARRARMSGGEAEVRQRWKRGEFCGEAGYRFA